VVRRVRTFLCYGSHNVEISEGASLVVGRGSICDVVIDDDLASRKHLEFELRGGVLTVTDLASRNGVLVNGLPIKDRQELHHGDQVTAGRTPLSIVQQSREPRSARSSNRPVATSSSEYEHTETGSLYQLLEGSARMALKAGDLTTAEGSARSLFVALRGFFARGLEVEPEWLRGGVILALDLAEAGQEPLWLERALELQTSAAIPLQNAAVLRLVELVPALRPSRQIVEAYVEMARGHGGDTSAAQLTGLAD